MSQPFDPARERLNQTPLNDPRLLSGPYWDELRTFLAVAKSKSFNRAAAMLNVSQPSVSRSIRRLQSMNQGAIELKGNIDRPGLGVELDEHLVDNERGIPEWQFPEMFDKFDGSVRDH